METFAKMPITIKDVARESGVNISTVSRALSGAYGVHQETREHVVAVAARLNYRPNRVARGLVTGRSHSIGLVVSDIRNPFFAEVVRGAEDAARAAHCDLVLCNSDLDPDKQMSYVRSLLEKRVDGILMNSVAELSRKQQNELASCGVPIVLLNRQGQGSGFSSVHADNERGGRLVAEYLVGLGHRHLAHITGPRRHGNMTDRARGFNSVLQAGGVSPVVLHGESSFSGAHDLTRKLLGQHPRTTAIFAANDMMAFGAARAIWEAGKRIPDDISLIGFDDLEISQVLHPPLTTIHQPKYETGQAAVQILMTQTDAKHHRVAEHRLLGVRLVERQSCRKIS